ncbi:hypothetical protein ALC53_09613 [Atta colombica]|uniref:Uncharacterized protein n=1 Tax=Atta colombica TaxID=520822 RepID=A0A151I144_9HYME|nr:hypothetical protein ALC53_09613 [Atta colombica]
MLESRRGYTQADPPSLVRYHGETRNLRKGKASLGNEAPQYDNAIMFPVPHFPGSAPNPCFWLPQPPCPLFNRDFAIVLGADCYFARALT